MKLNQIRYCAAEVERQHATPMHVFHMCNALEGAQAAFDYERFPSIDRLMQIGFWCDPEVNVRGEEFRTTPVTFAKGGSSSKAENIPANVVTLWYVSGVDDGTFDLKDTDEFVKNLLLIHPFRDGNGRSASIIRNWLLGTLDDPTPLPYYFGEN